MSTFDEKYGDIGLGPIEYRVLYHWLRLQSEGRDETLGEMAKVCMLTASQVANALDSLRNRGLVQ